MKKLWTAALLALLLAGCTPAGQPSSSPDQPSRPSASQQEESSPAREEDSREEPAGQESRPEGSSATDTPSPQPATWWQQDLAMEKLMPPDGCGTTTRYYLYDDVQKLSWSGLGLFSRTPATPADNLALYRVDLLLDSATEAEELGQPILPDLFFEISTPEDVKLTGRFYEKGVELTRSLPGQGYGDTVRLTLDETDYALIQQRIAPSRENANWANPEGESRAPWQYPAWLTMMRESRMTELTFTSREGSTHTYAGADILWYMAEDLVLPVTGPGVFTSQASLPDADMATVTFNNGLVYHIYTNESNVLVTTNDTAEGLLYPSGRYNQSFATMAEGHLDPPTGKPVIYLYPQEETTCTVTLDYPSFTYTYPAYNGGWQVTAYPDGRLINLADGSEHYYLFWEGNKRIQWDFESGFVVKGSDTEAFLREKLAYLGLTPREYNDFITYWVPRMQGAEYNLITFAGEQYEQLAPLTITPAPDSVLRVHMVYRSLNEPVEIPTQQLQPFSREGFTVVEWGGTDANYMK